MTKLISIFIVVGVVFCGWHFYKYWEQKLRDEEEQKIEKTINGDALPGMATYELDRTYQASRAKGPVVVREWLKVHGASVKDPRKAWVELDFVVSIMRDNPAEARQVFSSVKSRLKETSPVWPRMKELEKSIQ